MQKRDDRLLWLLPLCVLPLLLSLPFFSGQLLLFRDILHFSVPQQLFGARALHHLHLPLWDPGRYGGAPYLAEPGTGVFYPPNWLFALGLGDPFRFATLFVLVHLPVAAAGTLLLARTLGLSRGASALSAVGFAGSGYLLSMHGGHYYFASAALLPGVTALLLRARTPRTLALAALSVALLICNGELQAVAFAFALALLLGIAPDRTAPRRFLWIGAASLLGALLAAVQLLPTLAFARETVRASGLGFAEASSWALSPLRLVELLVPLPFGVAYPENGYWGTATGVHHLPWAASLYLGPAILVPALLAARHHLRLAAAAAFGLLLAAGPALPLFGLFFKLVPLANRFRFPEKYALVATLALALLGAAGLDGLVGAQRNRLFPALAAGLFACAAVAYVGPALLTGAVAAGLLRAEANQSVPVAMLGLSLALLHAALLCSALAGVLQLAKSRPALLVPLFVLAALVSQTVAGARVLSWGDGSFLRDEPALVQQIRAAQVPGSTGRLFNDGSCGFPGGGKGTLLERRRQWDWKSGKENFLTIYGVREALGYGASEWRRQVDYVHSLDRKSVPRLLGAALVLGCVKGVPQIRPVADPIPRVRLERGRAEVQDDAPERVRIAVQGEGKLVLADLLAPGWSARIDGRPAPLALSDGIWRSVEVPAGAREVVFEYSAPGLQAGAILSVLALVLVVALLFFVPV